jgi:hypothetical protein
MWVVRRETRVVPQVRNIKSYKARLRIKPILSGVDHYSISRVSFEVGKVLSTPVQRYGQLLYTLLTLILVFRTGA